MAEKVQCMTARQGAKNACYRTMVGGDGIEPPTLSV